MYCRFVTWELDCLSYFADNDERGAHMRAIISIAMPCKLRDVHKLVSTLSFFGQESRF